MRPERSSDPHVDGARRPVRVAERANRLARDTLEQRAEPIEVTVELRRGQHRQRLVAVGMRPDRAAEGGDLLGAHVELAAELGLVGELLGEERVDGLVPLGGLERHVEQVLDARRFGRVVAVVGLGERRVDRVGGDVEPFEQPAVVQALPQRVDLVHRERAALRQRLAGNEEDRGDAELLEDGQRQLELAAQPVVEGHDAGALREGSLPGHGRDELVARDELVRPPEQLELRRERPRRDREDRAALPLFGGHVVVADREQNHTAQANSDGRGRCRRA